MFQEGRNGKRHKYSFHRFFCLYLDLPFDVHCSIFQILISCHLHQFPFMYSSCAVTPLGCTFCFLFQGNSRGEACKMPGLVIMWNQDASKNWVLALLRKAKNMGYASRSVLGGYLAPFGNTCVAS